MTPNKSENERRIGTSDCGWCGGTGLVDSGGQTPWGAWIEVPCPHCRPDNRATLESEQDNIKEQTQ